MDKHNSVCTSYGVFKLLCSIFLIFLTFEKMLKLTLNIVVVFKACIKINISLDLKLKIVMAEKYIILKPLKNFKLYFQSSPSKSRMYYKHKECSLKS